MERYVGDAPFRPEEVAWYKSGEIRALEARERIASPTAIDPFKGGCGSELSSRERALLFGIAAAMGVGVASAERDAPAPETAPTVEVSERSSEVLLLQSIFKRGGEQVRNAESLKAKFSAEQIAVIADEIEHFPLEGILASLAARSGMSVDDLAKRSRLEIVHVYGEDDVQGMVMGIEDVGEREQLANRLERIGLNIGSRGIMINVTELDPSGSPDELRKRLRDLLMHEFNHSWAGNENLHHTPREQFVYEGFTEAIGNRTYRAVSGAGSQEDPIGGYISGSTAFAELLLVSTDEKALTRAYLQSDYAAMQAVVDAKFGANAWNQIVDFDATHDGEREAPYPYIAPVYQLVQEMGDDAPHYTALANQHLGTGKIFTHAEQGFASVFLVSDQAETGFSNGMIRREDGQTYIVTSNLPNGEKAFVAQQGEGTGIIFDNLSAYGSVASIDQANAPEIQGMIEQFVEAHRSVLE